MPVPVLTKNPTEVRTGPGALFIGPANAVEPTWTAAASKLTNSIPGMYSFGYTDSGIVVTFGARQTSSLTPAEEYEPIRIVTTGLDPTSIALDTFGVNERSMAFALNGGAWTTVGAGAGPTLVRRYTPPEAGQETRCSLVWVSGDTDEALFFPQCLQTGSITRTMTKGDTTSGLKGLTFQTEKTATPWAYLVAGAGWAGPTITS